MLRIDSQRCAAAAQVLTRIGYAPDTRSVTPFGDRPELERDFLFFLVAIDHKTHGAQRYEQMWEGELRHGSDLMYRKAAAAALKEQNLWTCDGVGSLTEEKASRIFETQAGVVPHGLTRRVELMKGAAHMLGQKYDGDILNLLEQTDGHLAGENGALERLAACEAYADPLQKKSQLLMKLLLRRNLAQIKDRQNLGAPPDHVLMITALRSGMLDAEEDLEGKLMDGEKLTPHELYRLRDATRQAIKAVAQLAKMDIADVDDVFWGLGRETTQPGPGEIRSVIDGQIKCEQARSEFLEMICGNGKRARLRVPVYEETEYF